MKATKMTVNPFEENIYILWNEDSHHALIIDPGMMQDHERDVITKFIDENGLKLQQVLLTHIHIDHVASARWTAQHYGVTVAGSELDCPLAEKLPEQAEHFRLRVPVDALVLDQNLKDGDVIMLDDEPLKVLAMPGHSPGGLAFYAPDSGIVFTGDSVFQGSVGRTDLYGGDMVVLLDSIRQQIFTLPPETVIAPGHGPTTTVADEQRYNPFLA